MSKRTMQAVLALLALLLAYYLPAAAKERNDSAASTQAAAMIQAVESTGAQTTEILYRTSVQLERVNSTKDLIALGSKWSKMLSVPVSHHLMRENELQVYETGIKTGGAKFQFRLIGVPNGEEYLTHLVLSIQGERSHLQDVVQLLQMADQTLRRAGVIPQFSTCIRGMYSDTLIDDQQEGKIFAVLTSLQANEIERLQDETVTSVSAYTELWGHFITTNHEKMNVQVATHLDKRNNVTRITVGTPIITAEY
ncbi:YwmB family TATA-box binding protein [Brevibacillus sp. B_LB10_24]|uniref:YwmB family TATA-box binding protein n=1 Tax=Brevibacillus sp. B_LB10_24 TaxID=3380645 RepID=UPI0038BCA585